MSARPPATQCLPLATSDGIPLASFPQVAETVRTVVADGAGGWYSVTFGGVAGTNLTVVSDTQLTVTSPAATTVGAVDVVVTTPDGAMTQAAGFTYQAPSPPPLWRIYLPLVQR
jgi:hypothetical protein